jgi:hypothetical protein
MKNVSVALLFAVLTASAVAFQVSSPPFHSSSIASGGLRMVATDLNVENAKDEDTDVTRPVRKTREVSDSNQSIDRSGQPIDWQ